MTNNQFRKYWLKLHRSYEKKAFAIFRKGLRDAANKIPWDNLDELNYIPSIQFNVSEEEIKKAYLKTYTTIGILYGNRVGRGINRDSKAFTLDNFADAYKKFLQQWLFNNAGLRIQTVRQSLIDYLLKEIANGMDEGLTIREVSARIQKLVNSRKFYRWQALRIARTETTASANYGASVAAEQSDYVLEKVWISSHDARTRRRPDDKYDHYVMEGVVTDEKGVFEVQGDFLRFPGDPLGSAGNIINCRCATALRPKRDANGRLIRKPGSFTGVTTPRRPINPIVPQTPQEPTNPTNVFTPAKTLQEAEQRILNAGVKRVNLKGFKKEEFNSVLKVVENESKFSKLDLDELETYRRSSSNANALYSPSNNKISINLSNIRKHVKDNVESYQYKIERYKKDIQYYKDGYLGNPKYNQTQVSNRISALNRKIRDIERRIDNGEESKVWSVSNTVEDSSEALGITLTHEIGHLRHYRQIGLNNYFRFKEELSISEYGRTNSKEYLAEWYAQYRTYGDKGVPSDLLELFKKLMK